MENQNQQQHLNKSTQTTHGGHEMIETHQVLSSLTGCMEQYVLYDQYVQDQELKNIMQQQRAFLSQLYNTIVDTLKTGQDPAVKTQTYLMDQENDVVYGMQPTQPKTPAQSTAEINDQCISSFMMDGLKANASSFTMAALEATYPVLRRVLADSIPNLIEMAYEVFLYQNKHQYYQVPLLKQADMQTYMNSFAPIQGTMPH